MVTRPGPGYAPGVAMPSLPISLLLLGVTVVGLVLAFRGVTLRTCPGGPRRAPGLLGGGLLAAGLGLGGLVFLHGPWEPGWGPMHGHGMRGMGPHHARPGVAASPARTLAPADLPDPGAPGARLLARHCGACHAVPDPALHTAAEWPAVLARMRTHMAAVGRPAPAGSEAAALAAYLAAHSVDAVDATPPPGPAAR